MKKTLAASLFALSLVAACTGNAASSVPGTYELDKTAIRDAMAADMTPEQKKDPQAMKMAEDAVNGMNVTIELKADNTANFKAKMAMAGMDMPEQNATGTWKLDGSKLSITTKEKDGKEETKVADYANGSFSFTDDAMGKNMKMTFKKK